MLPGSAGFHTSKEAHDRNEKLEDLDKEELPTIEAGTNESSASSRLMKGLHDGNENLAMADKCKPGDNLADAQSGEEEEEEAGAEAGPSWRDEILEPEASQEPVTTGQDLEEEMAASPDTSRPIIQVTEELIGATGDEFTGE
ncbi:hypothetical protein R1sor_006858 [Riccia sorocarpa]|uniref:Uncharacterized protein n=1 Tax=Riccia sorocarpa TaxID=122646 RepID=A0ABD3HS93_9MARC